MKAFVILSMIVLFFSSKQKENYAPIKKGVLVLLYENIGKADTISYEKDSLKYLEYKQFFPIKDGMINVFKISSGNYKINNKVSK